MMRWLPAMRATLKPVLSSALTILHPVARVLAASGDIHREGQFPWHAELGDEPVQCLA